MSQTSPHDAPRPATVLERAIARGQVADVRVDTVLWVLAASEVVFINESAPRDDEFPSEPLIVNRDGQEYLAIFSHAELASGYLAGERVVIRCPAFEILRRLPDSVGIVVNLGVKLGFEVPADGVRAFVSDLLQTSVSL